jgi:hypothetical protein
VRCSVASGTSSQKPPPRSADSRHEQVFDEG